ncbi:hypothetical protein CAPTEDRAFT_167337 [Capitella teleta]|uniref:LRRCT domain-containing protein n=1 Tax=Capitella teleta TaxID=283909 RepID=R7TN81_CAPTE|nr:hypothetical protein CAPTEDRAFT_167337 [Capitella teleta]|eukprot:ELT92540.1 hypothetical protein CAPTEDRAFT_167337 [Capitella teleta]
MGVHATEIDLQGNNLTDFIMPKAFFGASKYLMSLNLAWSNITSLRNRVFRGMLNLRNLTLAENRLRHLSPYIFQDLRSVEKISLAGNPLHELPSAIFRYQANLRELDLGYCSITWIPWHLFSGLWNLQTLDLRGNSIQSLALYTFGDLMSLHTLQLSHNRIRRLQSGVFKGLRNLQVLKLEEGPLEDIDYDVFRDTKHLVDLDLGDNRLTTLRVGTLLIPPLTHLRLDGNALRSVPHECTVQELVNLEFLNLRENPFMCDCSLFWLKEYERKLMRRWDDPTKPIPLVPGTCHAPAHLKGVVVTRWLDLDCLKRQHQKRAIHSCHRFWYW